MLYIVPLLFFCIGAVIAAARANRRGAGSLGVVFSGLVIGLVCAGFATFAAWVAVMIYWSMSL